MQPRDCAETPEFIALAPYAPRFPFEVWILPKVHSSSFENNQTPVFGALAKTLKDILTRIETVLDNPAYNLMIHTSPIGEELNPGIITGTSKSFPGSPKLPDLNGAADFIFVRLLRKNRRDFCVRLRFRCRRRRAPVVNSEKRVFPASSSSM